MRKTQFPRLVIPISTVLTGAFNLCLNLIIVFVFALAFGVDPAWSWLPLPIAAVVLFVFKASTYEHLLMINPLAVIFEQVRIWVLHEPQAPSIVDAAGGWTGLIPAPAILIAVCAFGIWTFNREAPKIAEQL